MNYKPPFIISDKIINLIADISAQIERYAIRMEQEDGVLLRKINRIKTIQGSLAIEGNSLGVDQITAIIEGKPVIGTMREIKEARNALKTYDAFKEFDPEEQNDLLRAHGLLMEALIDDCGKYRQGSVGVFANNKPIHIAPPASRVPSLMNNLFAWIKTSSNHLLIKSCVFHYEFEFIHPFMDGNGRIGRLWQSVILAKLHPIFEYLPVENMVLKNQQLYYKAIHDSTAKTNSGIFIEFMLGEILATLKNRRGEPLDKNDRGTVNDIVNANKNDTVNLNTKKILNLIKTNPKITIDDLSQKLKKSRRTITRLIKKLQEDGIISRVGSDKTGHWEVKLVNWRRH